MGQVGARDTGVMSRAMLSYGITADLQLSVSIPYVFSSTYMVPARMSAMLPGSADLEAIASYRFQQGTRIGTRIESTAYAGVIVPGPQRPAGMMGELRKLPANTVRFDDVIRVVRDKAFTPKKPESPPKLLSAGVKLQLKLRGTDEIYELTGDAAELKKNELCKGHRGEGHQAMTNASRGERCCGYRSDAGMNSPSAVICR